MIAAGINDQFGVLAADSAMYDNDSKKIYFESGKVSLIKDKYLMTFIGTPLYFSRIDWTRFELTLKGLSLYLSDYLRNMKPDVEKEIAKTTDDKDDRIANFCLFVMGLHNNRPTMVQFNSFKNFEPRYIWSENELKFSTIYYGDNEEKNNVFKESSEYMKKLSTKYEKPSVGLVAEILARGIYKKADLEENIGDKKKYAGGIVNAGFVTSLGSVHSLSGLEVIYGSN